MTLQSFTSSSRTYYRRYYRLVAVAVILMMAVLTGSLLLGDSVRGTLTDRVSERLGNAETIIATGTNFLDESIMQSELLEHSSGYLLAEGFLSEQNSIQGGEAGKLIPVYVWGTDADSIDYGNAIINEPLARKLSLSTDVVPKDLSLTLHLPSHSLVSSGTLFVTKSYSTQMRLNVQSVKTVHEGGNLLLKNEQALPLNIFVNRKQLAEVMELEGKLNLILSDDKISEAQFESIWNPELSGIHISDSTLVADRVFIPNSIVTHANPESTYLSYLVNDIIHGSDTIPYSFVTAIDRWKGMTLTKNDIVLSDYSAEKLHVTIGDTVRMSYFVSEKLKNLKTNEQSFYVKAIVPLSLIESDSLFLPEFPGLSNVERCTDWDSDLPIKMDRIHKTDEDYWYKHRQTPKALVSYEAVINDWGSSYGTATALRGNFSSCNTITLDDVGIIIRQPRADGFYAAQHGTDFSSLFLALGSFIILSAILLMQNTLLEMFIQRRGEIQLYQQLGYSAQHIRSLLFRESFMAILLASPLGVLAGLIYSGTTLWLLGNVWSGATHTEGFALHLHVSTIIIGWIVGLIICFLSLWYVINKQIKRNNV